MNNITWSVLGTPDPMKGHWSTLLIRGLCTGVIRAPCLGAAGLYMKSFDYSSKEDHTLFLRCLDHPKYLSWPLSGGLILASYYRGVGGQSTSKLWAAGFPGSPYTAGLACCWSAGSCGSAPATIASGASEVTNIVVP